MSDKEIRKYTIITSKGYWGKGDTPIEAAKNACVNASWTNGSLYYANQDFIQGEIECGDMGGANWHWKKECIPLIEETKGLKICLMDSIKTTGTMKILKGELIIQVKP